jgi:hypothetical protein
LGRDKRIGVRFGHTFFCQFDQLDEEKLKYDSLAQHQGFGPAFWGSYLKLIEGTAKMPAKSVINMI